MSSIDLFSMAVRNLIKRKLRTFLTVLGVIIGTASIVVMVSFGIGLNQSFTESMEMMGDITTITVYKPYNWGGSYSSSNTVMLGSPSSSSGSNNSETILLDDEAIESFKSIPNVVTATPFLDIYMDLSSGKYQSWGQVRGIDPVAMGILGYTPTTGRLLEETDTLQVVYGYEVPHDFYDPNDHNREWTWYDGIGEDLRVPPVDVFNDKVLLEFQANYGNDSSSTVAKPKGYTLEAIGILEKNYSNDRYIYMNIEHVKRIKLEKERYDAQNSSDSNNNANTPGGSASNKKTEEGYDTALVKCVDIDAVADVQKSITDMGFETQSPASYVTEMQNLSNIIQAVLGGIGGVSLLVAAIGISNTMIMSIYERTKEIGVMKVIGATLYDIGRLFLLEASLIGLLGGAVGLILSYTLSYLINTFGTSFGASMGMGSTLSVIPIWLALSALGFSAGIGLLSGYLPARRAMKLPAINAIRTD